MKHKTVIYRVFNPECSGGELICDIYNDGTYKISSYKGSKEDWSRESKFLDNLYYFYNEIAQNGHCTPNYVPYHSYEGKAFYTLCALFEGPVKSPLETKISPKKYYHGYTDKEAPLDQYLYIVEYFGKGEPWYDPYEGREDQRPTP